MMEKVMLPRKFGKHMQRKKLRRVQDHEVMLPGKYVLYSKSHFVGLEIWEDWTYIIRPTCRTHIGNVQMWHPHALTSYEAIFVLTGSSVEEEEDDKDKDSRGAAGMKAQELFKLTWP